MWVCLNNSFVSIVENYFNTDQVIVRGRRASDVRNFVLDQEKYTIIQTEKNDYAYRAFVPKTELGDMLIAAASKINYGNFKNSVKDHDLVHFYGEVWVSGVKNLDPNWSDRHM